MLGYSHEEIFPHINSWVDLLHPDDVADTLNTLNEHIEGKSTKFESEYRMKTKSGNWQWILGRGQVVTRRKSGQAMYMLGSFNDLTQRKQVESEMIRLRQLNLVSEIAASIAHEIRNPMTTVRGYLQILRENQDYIKEADYFDLMIEEIDRANSIISNFLSLAKNKMIELSPKSLNAILKNILPLLEASAMLQDKSIILELGDVIDLLLDENEIRQLILNLVNNALESIRPGKKVYIKTFMEQDQVVLAVQDEGCGIDSEVLKNLGMPFVTTKEQGTGLGLAVCYGIASHHTAKIEIETGASGTTFFIKFPIQ